MPIKTSSYTALSLSIISASLICYLNIGIMLAVLPTYLMSRLGFSSFAIGSIISIQFFATLLCRPIAGRMSDRVGGKQCVISGLILCALSGVAIYTSIHTNISQLVIILLVVSRISLGFSQGLIGTGTLAWIIGVAGKSRAGKMMSWNGMASYSAMAIGAPLGFFFYHTGMIFIGLFTLSSSLLAIVYCSTLRASSLQPGNRESFFKVLRLIAPYGLAISFANVGFSMVVTFITLFYASLGWAHGVWAITVFGFSFVMGRLIFARTIDYHGGYLVALVSFAIEASGLFIISLSSNSIGTFIGAMISGAGFSLIYPSLGVEVIHYISDANRSSALGAYSLCQDLSVGLAGPIAGGLIGTLGYAGVYGIAGVFSVIGILLVTYLRKTSTYNDKG